MIKRLSIKILVLSLLGCTGSLANNNINSVVVSHGKYSDYYHIKYTLTNDNFYLHKKEDSFSVEDGQFEIYLNKKKFPIPSPDCDSNLILRMPSTISDDERHEESIKNKKWLYEEIIKVHNSDLNSVDVVIELNPYVRIKSRNPLSLELETCNIFFRTKNNQYIDTLNQ